MIGVIYYDNYDEAYEKLMEILIKYDYDSVDTSELRFRNDGRLIEAKVDKDIWRLVKINDFAYGYRYNICYIPRSRLDDDDFIYKMLLPGLTLPPFQAMNYYGGTKDDKE